MARAVAQLALYELPDDSFERFVPQVNAVSDTEITRVARAYLQPSDMITVVVGDPDVVMPAMQKEGFPEPQVVTVD